MSLLPSIQAFLCVAAMALLVSSGRDAKQPPSSVQPEQVTAKPVEVHEPTITETHVEIVNVNIHLDASLILQVRHLTGKFLPTKKGQPPTFDDPLSYIIAIDSAEVALSPASMSHMMNAYVFGDPDAPLRNLQISIEGGRIKQKGTLKKGVEIPFEMVGDMSATPDGKIKIHPIKMRAAHLPVKGLMNIFGLDTAKLINTRNTRGMTVDDNDVILDPVQMMPPPKIRGQVTSVRIEGDKIVETFGQVKPERMKQSSKSNYMAYRGGVLQFGKLTMKDADMRLIDADPRDPFDFFPDHYKDQLVAGYSKTTASGGLLIYMPDYNKISKPHPAH
jgi:hypothetical protein